MAKEQFSKLRKMIPPIQMPKDFFTYKFSAISNQHAQGGVFDDSKSVMCFASWFLNRQKSCNLYGEHIISTSRSLPGGSYP
jgi:hypothetical protein